tara:strand:- start:1839 stop:2315 length:477 start_codon:yes stop_codon:yes gene_type:complete
MEQKEETRTEEQEVSKEAALAARLHMKTSNFLIKRNRFLCGMLQLWDRSMFQDRKRIRSQFSGQHPREEALIEYATLITFLGFYKQYGLHKKTGVSAKEAYLEYICNLDKVTSINSSSLYLLKLFHKYAKIIGEGGQGTNDMEMIMAIMTNSEEYTQN